MQDEQSFQLSIIVPVLDEAAELPHLVENLALQTGVSLELILCDGGSGDATPGLAAELAAHAACTIRLVRTVRGRGAQMNAGAAVARGELLLFLHADSRFDEPEALARAVDAFRSHLARHGSQELAARFGLRFRRSNATPSLAYCFYEAKARLARTDCIRGDQGFLMTRACFGRLGGFDTSLPFYEDVRLAERIGGLGIWLLLPVELSTSARRFETEGLLPRQIVNAIIVNNFVAGWSEFPAALPGLYQCHATTGRLQLYPLLTGVRSLLARQNPSWRRAFWRATGRHVATNIWQLFFWLDVRHAFRAEKGPGEVDARWLGFYCRHLERFTRSRLLAVVTAAVVRFWFRAMLVTYRIAKS